MGATNAIFYEYYIVVYPKIKYHTTRFRIKLFSSRITSLTAIELLYKNTVSYDEEHFNFHLDMLDKKRINELQHQLNYLNAVVMTDVSETTFAGTVRRRL